jgi:Zinc-finger of C2H2 type
MPVSATPGISRESGGNLATRERAARRKRAAQKQSSHKNSLAVDQYLIKSSFLGTSASTAHRRRDVPEIYANDASSSGLPVVPGAQRQAAQGAQRLGSDVEGNSVPHAGGSGVARSTMPETLPAMTRMGVNGKLLCNICHVPCSSMKNLNEHLRGRRHRMNVFLRAVDSLRLVSF